MTLGGSKKTALGLIFAIMLLDVTGVTILYPVAAYIVREYSSQALMVTLLSVIYAAAQFFAAPVLGKLSDRAGRRPVLLVSLLGSAIGYLIFGFGGALWVLLLSRLIDGVTGGNMSTASAYIADLSTPDELAKNFTLVGIAWGVGLVLGPTLGGALGQVHLRAPAFAAAGLTLLNLIASFFLLPESLPQERRKVDAMRASDFNAFASIRELGRIPGLGVLLVVLCLFNLGFNSMNSTETLFLIQKFDAQPWQVGLLLVLIGVSIALFQGPLVQRMTPRFGETALAATGLLAQASGALGVWLSPLFPLVYPIVVLRSLIGGFVFPALGALNVRRVPPEEQGLLMGVTTSLNSLASILGPILAGLLFDHLSPGAPFWLSAALYIAAAMLLIFRNRAMTRKAELAAAQALAAATQREAEEEQEDMDAIAAISLVGESDTKIQIEKFIETNPELVTNLLRSWLADDQE